VAGANLNLQHVFKPGSRPKKLENSTDIIASVRQVGTT
jgi:hypothetical protein